MQSFSLYRKADKSGKRTRGPLSISPPEPPTPTAKPPLRLRLKLPARPRIPKVMTLLERVEPLGLIRVRLHRLPAVGTVLFPTAALIMPVDVAIAARVDIAVIPRDSAPRVLIAHDAFRARLVI